MPRRSLERADISVHPSSMHRASELSDLVKSLSVRSIRNSSTGCAPHEEGLDAYSERLKPRPRIFPRMMVESRNAIDLNSIK
jgi:hypothetical protein